MYKVLIIDEYYYIRERLKTCDRHGKRRDLKGAGEASNTQKKPSLCIGKWGIDDMAVVDISMPQRTTTLIQELRGKRITAVKNASCMSGGGTFTYAQRPSGTVY